VRLPSRLRLDPDCRRRLAAAAGGLEPVDTALVGGRVLNVFTGHVQDVGIGILGGRIAWVGEPPGEAAATVELDGATVVPGLIDPHAHGDIVCTPIAFAHEAVRHGTTTVVLDAYTLAAFLDDHELARVMDAVEASEMKVLWGLRPARDAGGPADDVALPRERLARLLARPGVSSTGETTAWRALLEGDKRVGGFLSDAIDAGLNVDGHLPGASPRTLARLAAAGITSDHEAITGAELAARVEVGMWAMVRNSSLRPDGEALGRAIVADRFPHDRLLLTADGVVPTDLVHGHLDTVVREVVRGGVDPVAAVRMGTLNAAVYLGLDTHLGAIAPGRCADLIVLDDLARFEPARVMSDGRFLDRDAPLRDPVDWAALTVPIRAAALDADTIARACSPAPAIRMQGVIARLDDEPGPQPAYVALVARDGSAITGTTTRDFDVRAVATSVTATTDVLLLGTDAAELARLYHRVVALGGGTATPDAELALPVFGHLSPAALPELAVALEHVERSLPNGGPPFTYRSLFLTLPALPGICVTPAGLLDVRARRIVSEGVAL
jgi:adenine deaminase